MALPGHRRTSSHKRRRASHFAVQKLNLAACAACKQPILPHRVCASCGMYGGRKVIEVRSKAKRAAAAKKK